MLSDAEVWNLLGHKIQVDLDTGDARRKETTIGHLVTRDPVSQSLVLAKIGEGNTIEKMEWIPSTSVKSIKPLEESASDEVNAAIEKYFEDKNVGGEDSEEKIQERAHKVVNFLRSHHLDVAENPPGTYLIAGAVRFEKPYHPSNLYCDIPIVLKRILKLVEQIE